MRRVITLGIIEIFRIIERPNFLPGPWGFTGFYDNIRHDLTGPTVRELAAGDAWPLPAPPALRRCRMDRLIGKRELRIGLRDGKGV